MLLVPQHMLAVEVLETVDSVFAFEIVGGIFEIE